MLAELGISEEDWSATPQSVRTALAVLWQQNLLLQKQCALYDCQLRTLQSQVTELESLRAEVAELRERLGQNSSNSSRPPSSDPPSAPRQAKRESTGRKRGGQQGHQGHGRSLLPPEQVDHLVELRPVSCHQCGHLLLGEDPEPARRQISELPRVKAEVTEYRQHTLQCADCGACTAAEWPAQMPVGSFGPRVQAIVGYLTGRLGLSHRDVTETLEALYGLEIGLGTIAALQRQLSAALAQPVETAEKFAHRQVVHHVDETGWAESNKQKWLWIHATPEVTVFKIQPGRGKKDALAVLGLKYAGVANTDRYNAYHWMDEGKRQLCWAHLKREAQAISERGGKSAEIGQELLAEVKNLFERWYQLREGSIERQAFQTAMEPIEQRVGELLRAGTECGQEKTQGACRNILKWERSLWTFVRVEGIEPTNNNAERPLRRAVLWRRKSFGTQSEKGSRFAERILTAVTTLRQQQRDVLGYLTAVCQAALGQPSACCLLPNSS
jgi:transposase